MITVNPSNPTSDNSIEFVFTGAATCKGVSTTIEGHHFIFELVPADPPVPCLSAPIPYETEWPIGRLRAGEYQVTQKDTGVVLASVEFSVAQGDLPFPTPPIPTMGFVGVALLALALLWGAHKALKRTSNRAA